LSNKLLIGSANKNKTSELVQLLGVHDWEIVSLAELDEIEAPEETGKTFCDNALLKAMYYSRHYNLPCVADDSGLMVDVLKGAPGVYSARYAGPKCTDDENNLKLLDELQLFPWHERTARFICCAAYANAELGVTHFEEGVIEGHISMMLFGENGFGYDPLFVPLGHEITFAEMSSAQKHTLSHRGRALEKMCAYLLSEQGVI